MSRSGILNSNTGTGNYGAGGNVDTADKNAAKIQEYIKYQPEEEKTGEQLSGPFTGRKSSTDAYVRLRCAW